MISSLFYCPSYLYTEQFMRACMPTCKDEGNSQKKCRSHCSCMGTCLKDGKSYPTCWYKCPEIEVNVKKGEKFKSYF